MTEFNTGTSTVTQTVPTTTTNLLACTNSDIHKAEDMCSVGGDGSFPIFRFEAPPTLGISGETITINKRDILTNKSGVTNNCALI